MLIKLKVDDIELVYENETNQRDSAVDHPGKSCHEALLAVIATMGNTAASLMEKQNH